MLIHQLNCGTLAGLNPTRILLIESPTGLVLVDTGFGLQDIADPAGRLGPLRHVLRPALSPAETAVRQIEALGLDPQDVRHIVLTHFDLDHIGGLADFPDAEIHVTAAALTSAVRTPSFVEKKRYRLAQLAHNPRFTEYEYGTDRWEGFRVRYVDHVLPGMMFVDLPGHAIGHAGVFVPAGRAGSNAGGNKNAGEKEYDDDNAGKDVLHAGDAFYHRGQIDPSIGYPAAIRIQERIMALEPGAIPLTHTGLTSLAERRADTLDIVCSHERSGPGGLQMRRAGTAPGVEDSAAQAAGGSAAPVAGDQ